MKDIIFDFGGVIMDWNPRYAFKKIFNDDVKMEWFFSNICTNEWNLQIDKGKPFAEAVKELQAIHPEYSIEIKAYHDKWEEMLKGEIKESVEILYDLKEQNYNLYGLTNWSAETFYPIAQKKYPCLNVFKGIVVSGSEKLIKPDIQIFIVLLNRYNLKSTNCIFIDDNIENIKSAKSLGINGIHFESPEKLKKDLLKYDIKVK